MTPLQILAEQAGTRVPSYSRCHSSLCLLHQQQGLIKCDLNNSHINLVFRVTLELLSYSFYNQSIPKPLRNLPSKKEKHPPQCILPVTDTMACAGGMASLAGSCHKKILKPPCTFHTTLFRDANKPTK